MAKPNAQTGHGSSSGTADESTLPNGENSRRGADDGADAPRADWGLPNANDESKLSRILGLVLVLVLAGVFSFIAYRKYNEARLHPGPETTANGPISPQPQTGAETQSSANGEAQNSTLASTSPPQDAAGGATVASNSPSSNQSQSAFQLDDTPNSNAPFQPSGVGRAPERSADRPAAPHHQQQTAANENDVNPFNDTSSGASSLTGAAEKGGQLEANRPNPGGSKSVAAGEQAEPLFETSGQQPGPAAARNGQVAADASGLAAHQEGGKVSIQSEPVQTAHSETAGANQSAGAPNPPAQTEPGTNDLLNDSPKPAAVAKGEPQTVPENGAPSRSKVPATNLLDQEEPLPTTARREPLPTGPGSASSLDAAQSSQASSATTVHVGRAPSPPAETTKGSDNEDLFATKTVNARPTTVDPTAPQANRSIAGTGAAAPDASLNDAGDYYVVQPQDNFWTISRKKYGTARYFMALAQLNKAHVPDPTRMRPGVRVSTPPTEILETRFAQYLPKGSAVEVASGERLAGKSGPAGFFTSADGKAMYRTGEKDTLSDIAARHLGRASRWIQIYEMNRDKLATPNQLKIGTELVLPTDASNVAVTNDNDQRR
jgi:nucleoid-associated protein YgaU